MDTPAFLSIFDKQTTTKTPPKSSSFGN